MSFRSSTSDNFRRYLVKQSLIHERSSRLMRPWRTYLAAIIAGFALVCSGCGHGPLPPEGATASTGRAYAPAARELGIEHAAKVAPGIYRGGQPTHQGFVSLKNHGFRTVVNLRSFHSERN